MKSKSKNFQKHKKLKAIHAISTSIAFGLFFLIYNNFNLFRPNLVEVDLEKPVVELIGENIITLEVNEPYQEPGAIVIDNIDQNLQLIINGFVNAEKIGTYQLIYSAIDNSGNASEEVIRTVKVVDTTPPTLILNGDANINLNIGEVFVEPGYQAIDNYDSFNNIKVVITGTININEFGIYKLNYMAEDSSGNKSEILVRTVEVEREIIDISVLNNVVTLVTIDINPSIVITLDGNDIVISAFGNNLDGIMVILNSNLSRLTLEQALSSIIQKANEKGFISSKDAVLIGIESNNTNKRNALENITKSVIDNKATEFGKEIVVQVEKFNLNLEESLKTINGEQATASKTKIIEYIKEVSKDSTVKFEDFRISDLIEKKKELTPTSPIFSGGGGGGGVSPAPSSYTISFNSNGGSSVSNITSNANVGISAPINPTKVGHTFEGWFSDITLNTPFIFSTMPANNTTLYAKWGLNNYTISYYIIDNFSVEKISSGLDSTGYVDLDGKLFMWGLNNNGQIGDGTTVNKLLPTEITPYFNLQDGDRIIDLSIGGYHSAAVSLDGRVFIWGLNENGQLGDGTNIDKLIPNEITSNFYLESGDRIVLVSLGLFHSSALSLKGRIFTFGDNQYGQLGDNTTTQRQVPIEITSNFSLTEGDKIAAISMGDSHSSAISSAGLVFTWGSNYSGQLGDGTIINKVKPIDITKNFYLNENDKVTRISLGGAHSSASTLSGRSFTWGWNGFWQLGDGTNINKFFPHEIDNNFGNKYTHISLGDVHSSGINQIGEIYTWGYNFYGQLGDGTNTSKPLANNITSNFGALLYNEKLTHATLGYFHSSALTSTGRVFTWGYNGYGQLGDGTTNNKLLPTEIIGPNKKILETETYQYGQVISSLTVPQDPFYEYSLHEGNNPESEFTIPTTMPGRDLEVFVLKTPIQFSIDYNLNGGTNSVLNPSSYTILSNFVLANPFKEGHRFEGWFEDSDLTKEANTTFSNSNGIKTFYAKWSINSYSVSYHYIESYLSEYNILLENGDKIVATSLGNEYSSALSSTGRVFTWGLNNYGQLGDSTTISKSVPTEITSRFSLVAGDKIVAISLGFEHSSALSSTGRVFTWGYNGYGQLGDATTGSNNNKSVPTEITSRFSLGEGNQIVTISLGGNHSSAISSTGRVFTWGYNGYGQLGDATTSIRSFPTEITSRFSLAVSDQIVSISLGGLHSSAISSTGRVFTWGFNGYGQLGDNTTTDKLIPTEITSSFSLVAGDKIVSVSFGGEYSSAISATGRVFTWGLNNYGQLGDSTIYISKSVPTEITSRFSLVAGDKIVAISLGGVHSSAISATGRVFTWGNNDYGQLGDNTTSSKLVPTEITSRFSLAAGDKIVAISLGGIHSSAISLTGQVFTWGYNFAGQLGDATNINSLTPINLSSLYKVLLISYQKEYLAEINESIPSESGYTYSPWYEASDLVTPYVFTTMPSRNLNLYTIRTPITYTITYNLDGGVNNPNNLTSYIIEDSISILEPSKEGYSFIGWFEDSNLTQAATTTFSNTTGNKTFYAKWSAIDE